MKFKEWADKRGVWPRLTHKEIWDAAAEAEREECAKLVDYTFYRDLGSQPHLQGIRTNFADRIRARGNKGKLK